METVGSSYAPGTEEARKLQKLQEHRPFEKNPVDSDLWMLQANAVHSLGRSHTAVFKMGENRKLKELPRERSLWNDAPGAKKKARSKQAEVSPLALVSQVLSVAVYCIC